MNACVSAIEKRSLLFSEDDGSGGSSMCVFDFILCFFPSPKASLGQKEWNWEMEKGIQRSVAEGAEKNGKSWSWGEQ